MKRLLKLHPLTLIGGVVCIASAGMIWQKNSFNDLLIGYHNRPNTSQPITGSSTLKAAAIIAETSTNIATHIPASATVTTRPALHEPDPALTSLMQAIVLQSLESGVYTLATLPSELKPFAPRQFGRNTVANSEDEIQSTTQETIPVIDEDKFAELSADDYVPPEPEFKCPDPYDLPPHMRNSHNIEAIKARGCEVYMEDQQVQAQPQEPDIINDDTAMYESSI